MFLFIFQSAYFLTLTDCLKNNKTRNNKFDKIVKHQNELITSKKSQIFMTVTLKSIVLNISLYRLRFKNKAHFSAFYGMYVLV